MPTAKVRASTILSAFEQAQTELVGKAVILTDGKAGTVAAALDLLARRHNAPNSEIGTFETCREVRRSVAIRG
jgi:hypothetical protein